MIFNSPISSVGIYPGFAFMTSGILFTMLAQVNSTVFGLFIISAVFGSPWIIHSFLSNSSNISSAPCAFASVNP